jgi:ribA/ribD-fused uncharacterized protein
MAIPENAVAIWDKRHNLANFAPITVTIRNGQDVFSSSEQLYQMAKFLPNEVDIRNEIKIASSPREAKNLARKYKNKIRSDWDTIRKDAMHGIIRLKIRQHPDLQQELRDTGGKAIYEDADQYAPENPDKTMIAEFRRWGIYKGKGQNWIGEILTELRSELQANGRV